MGPNKPNPPSSRVVGWAVCGRMDDERRPRKRRATHRSRAEADGVEQRAPDVAALVAQREAGERAARARVGDGRARALERLERERA